MTGRDTKYTRSEREVNECHQQPLMDERRFELTHHYVDGEGHDESGNEQISNGQTDDEVIGGCL